MFFPEEQKFLAGEVDRYHLVYTNPGKWNSSSPYEQTFQHKNDLIVLYDIADSVRHPHADGFFPKTLDERIVDPTGWVFARWDSVYVGVFPLSAAEWIPDSICWRWRSTSRRTGWVVEVRSYEEAGSFDAFQRSLRSRVPDAAGFARTGSVAFTTAGGDRMAFGLKGSRKLNGRAVSFKDYPLYDGPWMHARVGEGVITLTDGIRTRVLDFNKGEVRER